MIYKYAYCRFCSADAHDLRIMKIEKFTIKCDNCGKMLFQVPSGEKSPYYYLKEIPEVSSHQKRIGDHK